MGEERRVKNAYRTNVECNRRKGRPHGRWGDEAKELLIRRGLSERIEYYYLGTRRHGVAVYGL